MPEWKPIETAPMDGTRIKVRGWDFGIEGSRRHYAIAFYEDGDWLQVGSNGNRLRYLTEWQELTQTSEQAAGYSIHVLWTDLVAPILRLAVTDPCPRYQIFRKTAERWFMP